MSASSIAEHDVSSLSDAALMISVGRGHEAALGELYQRHAGAVSGLARRIMGVSALADDVVQDVFERLWDKPEGFDPERGSLRTYLLTRCHGRCVDLVRSEDARRGREIRDANTTTRTATCEDAVMEQDAARQLHVAMAALPDREREPIELAFFGGYSYCQVAELLGHPEGTVKTRIRAGLARLRVDLQAFP